MSYKQRVTIPQGYCFVPSCQSTISSSRSATTSTTTVFGPTLTAPVPKQKRSADDTVVAKLGTDTFDNNFPTDAPVVVGKGPVCIVFCEWAERQERGEDDDDDNKPQSKTDLTSSSSSTTGDTMATTTISTIIGSITLTLPPGHTPTKPFPHQTLGYMTTPTPGATPSPSASKTDKLSPVSIFGIATGVLAGLALVLGVAWLITRKVRQVKAKLNVHNRGVHRDFEREVYAMENGVGVPEMGKHVTGKERQKSL
ncbi:MAG: hypothetical protein Q9174_002139 [Haloplaca sp. 1 TL-2023]